MNLVRISITIFMIGASQARNLPKTDVCAQILGDDLIKEIAQYESVKEQIVNYVIEGDFKGKTYDE